jgi:hypothetical protein
MSVAANAAVPFILKHPESTGMAVGILELKAGVVYYGAQPAGRPGAEH